MPEREFDPMFLYAKTEIRRFMIAQYLTGIGGYPRRAAFAVDIARGDIGLPPPVDEDPAMNCVARWFREQRQVDRTVLAASFLPGNGTERQQARRVGLSKQQLRDRIDSLIRRCARVLRDAGFDSRENTGFSLSASKL